MRVLLVEDDPTLARGISEFLHGQGDDIVHENDGLRADRLLQDSNFDFVLADVGLPSLGGYEIVRRIRSRGQRRTGNHQQRERECAQASHRQQLVQGEV